MQVGDVGVWEGFTSTSYQKKETEQFDFQNCRAIKIYAPQGTSGLVINIKNGLSEHDEHELLLNKKMRFYVLSTNKEEIEVVILP